MLLDERTSLHSEQLFQARILVVFFPQRHFILDSAFANSRKPVLQFLWPLIGIGACRVSPVCHVAALPFMSATTAAIDMREHENSPVKAIWTSITAELQGAPSTAGDSSGAWQMHNDFAKDNIHEGLKRNKTPCKKTEVNIIHFAQTSFAKVNNKHDQNNRTAQILFCKNSHP